jgi:hypothetical protein
MAEPQADGAYPRLNAAMVGSGKYNGMIVSLVGKFLSPVQFQCCDGGTVELSGDHADLSEMDFNSGMVVEIVGQVSSPTLVAVRKNCYCVFESNVCPRSVVLVGSVAAIRRATCLRHSSDFVFVWSTLGKKNSLYRN